MPQAKTFVQSPFIVKAIEWILGLVCLVLFVKHTCVSTAQKLEVEHAAYFGFFIVACILILSYVLDTPIGGKLMMIIGVAGGVMYITAGSLCLEHYDKSTFKDKNCLALGIVAIVCGVAYLVDVIITWKY